MKKLILFSVMMAFFACTEAPKSPDKMANQVDSTVSKMQTANRSMAAVDSLEITVDSTGAIKMGDQKIKMDNLESVLADSLQIIKKKYGKLPDTIICRTKGDVLMGTRGAIKDAILDAKEKVEKQ